MALTSDGRTAVITESVRDIAALAVRADHLTHKLLAARRGYCFRATRPSADS
jgi:hypothetical protein